MDDAASGDVDEAAGEDSGRTDIAWLLLPSL